MPILEIVCHHCSAFIDRTDFDFTSHKCVVWLYPGQVRVSAL